MGQPLRLGQDLTASDVQQARLLSSDSEESVRVEMPWPLLSGRYVTITAFGTIFFVGGQVLGGYLVELVA